MKQITSKQLAYILSISHKDAMKIMVRAKMKNGEKIKEVDIQYQDEILADIDIVSKETGANIQMAIDDIRNNSLSLPAFKKWILQDYVLEKLKAQKPPRKISLPPALKSLLPEETIGYIKNYWTEKFSAFRNPEWNDRDANVRFEP